MNASRTWATLVLVTGALVIAVGTDRTTAGSSPAVAASSAGLTYGAHLGGGRDVWLRLRADRRRIVSLQFEWEIPASGCTTSGLTSDLRSSSTWTGSEADHPVAVRDGRFVTRDSSEYPYEGYSFVEQVRIAGVIRGRRVDGTIDVTLVATRRDGPGGFRCTMSAKRWSAAD